MDCSTPDLPVHHQISELAQTHVHWVGDAIHLILCHPLLLLPSVFPSIRESVLCIRWPECWSFSFSISLSNKYSGMISFRMDWLDLLAVQGTLKSLFQHRSSKGSILRPSAFLIVPTLTSSYMTAGKTIILTRRTFVCKVISLLFSMLSRFVIAFLPRSKHLWISWLQSPSAVILEPEKIQVCHCFFCFPIYLPWSDGTRCPDLDGSRGSDIEHPVEGAVSILFQDWSARFPLSSSVPVEQVGVRTSPVSCWLARRICHWIHKRYIINLREITVRDSFFFTV